MEWTRPNPRITQRHLWVTMSRDVRDFRAGSDGVVWKVRPTVLFRAQSIFALGPPDEVLTITMANQLVIDRCPLRILSTCHSLEELGSLSVDGKLRAGLLDCPSLTPTTEMWVHHQGNLEWIACYGYMVTG